MLSRLDLERLIAAKRREIHEEKTVLGLAHELVDENATEADSKENLSKAVKQVNFSKPKILTEQNVTKQECVRDKTENSEPMRDFEEIPADLERYIRRYLGLPVMLKAGEYSPNNPLIRTERTAGDALLGLGEYERRRNTLRKIRQRQYREYLDQQAKIKQEAKEKAERERREREERERLIEERERERERERELERERYSPERRRGSVNYTQVSGANNAYTIKVDTAVQVNNVAKPLSVAVQTDSEDLFRLSPTPKNLLTQAERELSPRTVVDSRDDRPIQPAPWALREQWKDVGTDWKNSTADWKDPSQDWKDLRRELEDREWNESVRDWRSGEGNERKHERRRSYGDFDDRARRPPRDKASSETRTYRPSIFDADAIELRNLQAEQEATARRQFYQQELKNQILEQQRIREERKTREKMLEQAEMRRLEQQLRSLRAAHDGERERAANLDRKIRDDESEYDRRRTALQKEIDSEHQALGRASHSYADRPAHTSKSETLPSKLPFYYPKTHESLIKGQEGKETQRPPYSTNIPDNSVFSPNYDVESYLRRNLNPTRESLHCNRLTEKYAHGGAPARTGAAAGDQVAGPERPKPAERKLDRPRVVALPKVNDRPAVTERTHDRPKFDDRSKFDDRPKIEQRYEPASAAAGSEEDPLPIPVLRHAPAPRVGDGGGGGGGGGGVGGGLSDAMRLVDDKWRVPAVQRNILKSLPDGDGRSVSILTQLGSIRRQLQLEQLRLDNMAAGDGDECKLPL